MMKKALFISFSSSADDRFAWSGTVYQSLQGLKKAGYGVDFLYAYQNYKGTVLDKLLCKYWMTVPKLFNKGIRMDESFYNALCYKQTLIDFDYSPYDIIFVPADIAIVYTLPKNIKAKIVLLSDATIDSLFEYYNEFSNLWFHSYWEAHHICKHAFLRADLNIVSSDWCRQNAINQYGCDPNRVVVVEFGANIDMKDVPATSKKIDGKRHLNIYFSTVNWVRKGGDVVLACCEDLISRGMNITLHITGIKRDDPISERLSKLAYVKNYGFLNKNDKEQYQKIITIMNDMDIFLFPSRAECSSIALCEANGFGLPCFVYDTGGTSNYVVDGENGYMLPLTADGRQFADCIMRCIDSQTLSRLSECAVKRYREKLNWDSWSKRVKLALDKLF